MATKSKQIKSNKKPIKKVTAPVVSEDNEEMLDISPIKAKKPVDLDIPEPIMDIEEKVEVEVAVETETEEDEETLAIDEEDVNPFGDKWEI